MKILVFGTFDHLHPGHRSVLDEASKRGALFVIVARESTVQRIKKKQPAQSEGERVDAIRAAYPNADVRLGEQTDFLAPVVAIEPDLILLGYDQQMPPGVEESSLPCAVERLPAFHPEKFKSSLL